MFTNQDTSRRTYKCLSPTPSLFYAIVFVTSLWAESSNLPRWTGTSVMPEAVDGLQRAAAAVIQTDGLRARASIKIATELAGQSIMFPGRAFEIAFGESDYNNVD
ncbi:hypothetical protein MAPG_09544 [Magnaporthiopsis poae ATCC 64411]|uniref:Uncharacterized protein n=1 Tax=Magnaporthiopsis poae (strain ATCC 64411 / 73-15) TaxID=644358 RepID=A0A0C4EA85_MAGP6|nr:hypothetical protein MAPG_09544 [Magnaporthiopsis poae ATCC 64411]